MRGAKARRRLAQHAGQVGYVQCDLRDPSWIGQVGNPFDLAVSAIAIHNLGGLGAMAACYRGIARVIEPDALFLDYDLFDRFGGIAVHTRLLQEAGFARVDCVWEQSPLAIVAAYSGAASYPRRTAMRSTAVEVADLGFGPLERKHLQYANYCAVAGGAEITRTHWHIALANGLGWGFDGMDSSLFGLVSPLIITEFTLDVPTYRSGLQIALLVGIVGLYFWPWLSDRYGRRTLLAIQYCAVFFADGRRFAVDRGSVHDRAARLHVRDRRLGQIEHAVDVGAEGEVPLLVADLLEADMGHLIGGVDRFLGRATE
jgi:hypothetical protein